MHLSRALRLAPGRVVAFTGAGGKTTAIRTLVSEIAAGVATDMDRVLVTTSTRIGAAQADLADHHWADPSSDDIAGLSELLNQHRSLLITGPPADDEAKWTALNADALGEIGRIAQSTGVPLLIEADGARGASLKAPADHEPAIPAFVDIVVPMAALNALGSTINSQRVHRSEQVATLLDSAPKHTLTPRDIAGVLSHERGGLKRVPSGAEVRVLLNRAGGTGLDVGRQIAEALLSKPQIQAVALADLQGQDPVHEVQARVAGVVLAAGGSSRLGEPKQLVKWQGDPLVLNAVRAARQAGLDPLVVVLGESAEAVGKILGDEDLETVVNARWQEGQSISVKAGLERVESGAEAVIFLLADMPFVGPELLRALVERHRRTLAPLVVPWAGGRRANPLLFDRLTFTELHAVQGDQGGRAILKRFDREFVEWDDSILFDVDTPADLERLRQME